VSLSLRLAGKHRFVEVVRASHADENSRRTDGATPVVTPVVYVPISGILPCFVRYFALPGERVEERETLVFQGF
jgi:hypothetical protein